MIGRITGRLLEISENLALVDVAGIAYEVLVSARAREALPGPGGETTLHTHFVVREDAQLLYGFVSAVERDLFRSYIRINGIGPRLGLAIVSSITMRDLAVAVQANDVSALTRVPGVGKKTAERLLVEMRGKLPALPALEPAAVLDPGASEEAERALVALGYKPGEAARVVASVVGELEEAGTTAEVVRAALKRIARQSGVSA